MAKMGVNLVVALFVGALMAAFLFPVAIGAMVDDDTLTATQTAGETVELQGSLNATVDSVTAGTSATYTIQAGGDSASTTVNEGANETVTVDGADVNIALSNVTSTEATTTYTYPTTYGWGGGAAALWVILPLLLVLAVFLYFVGAALGEL